ncbi:hypothetical protein J2N86_01635 [Legionella lytica]|uniref:Uncharacterized protein n=1 Tax=Legionella lytica TaxID=96232 RepID=A0ABY4Y9M1_9GAMM|nr:hypothetical protein [Legionella lytica]USQ14063.1 hypothetical protein J2N86_01635 [Legionella lytica]
MPGSKAKPFLLTMLGTDTKLSPTTKKIKKERVLQKGEVVSDYPKGESLSLVSMQVQVEGKAEITQGPIPYKTDEVTVVNGPTTSGANVGEKIGFGVAEILLAIARGQLPVNIIAHSRGAVESTLIMHEVQAIQNMIAACNSIDEVIAELFRQQTERHNAKKPINNTPDIIAHLKAQLQLIPQEERETWFESLKKNIPNASINFFGIDPVPGDCFPITWYDNRYFTIPPIAKNVQILYYENEHSSLGFTPAWIQPESPEQKFVYHTIPGHHGTGSAGNNGSQQKVVMTDPSVKATHVQKLLIYKLLDFLNQHGVSFKDLSSELFQKHTALGRKYAMMLKDDDLSEISDIFEDLELDDVQLDVSDKIDEHSEQIKPVVNAASTNDKKIDVAKLNFPAIFRELYDKIALNRKAYEAFNNTCYIMMGVTPQRRILRKDDSGKTDHTYGFLTDAISINSGFVNDEHATLIKEYFFSMFQLDRAPENLAAIVNEVSAVLEKNIKPLADHDQIEDLTNSYILVDNKNANLRDKATRDVVSKTFGGVIQLVSTHYLTVDWSSADKQAEKQQLFDAIINLLHKFKELSALQDVIAQTFVSELTALAVSGIGDTLEDQYQILTKSYARINEATDKRLQRFFHDLSTQFAVNGTNFAINEAVAEIIESPAYNELADHPPALKIAYIFEQLSTMNGCAELIVKIEENFNQHHSKIGSNEENDNDTDIIEELAGNFVEQYADSMDAFAKLHEQIQVFMNDLSALSNLVPEKTGDFGVYVLKLRQNSLTLVERAAQKFYYGHHLDELPPIARAGTFAELVERYAIENYGIVDRAKENQIALENENEQLRLANGQLNNDKSELQDQLNTTNEENANVKRQIKKKTQKNQKFQAALNSEEEAKNLLLISQKLRPLTEDYLRKLENSTSDENGTRSKKIEHLNALLESLNDTVTHPKPSKRVKEFYDKLKVATQELDKHRDKDWIRYVKNTVIASAILVTAVLPGLLFLLAYVKITGNSPYFWASQGSSFVNELNKVRPLPSAAKETGERVVENNEEEVEVVVNNPLNASV